MFGALQFQDDRRLSIFSIYDELVNQVRPHNRPDLTELQRMVQDFCQTKPLQAGLSVTLDRALSRITKTRQGAFIHFYYSAMLVETLIDQETALFKRLIADCPLPAEQHLGIWRELAFKVLDLGLFGHLEFLLDHGVPLDIRHPALDHSSLLHCCISLQKPNWAQALLKRGSPADLVDDQGFTPLHKACASGFYALSAELLALGAQVQAASAKSNLTALHFSAGLGSPALCALLIDHGALINVKTAQDNLSPLLIAVKKGHLDVVRYLINQGAELDASADGISPLYLAITSNNEAIARVLLENNKHALTKSECLRLIPQISNQERINFLDLFESFNLDLSALHTTALEMVRLAIEQDKVRLFNYLINKHTALKHQASAIVADLIRFGRDTWLINFSQHSALSLSGDAWRQTFKARKTVSITTLLVLLGQPLNQALADSRLQALIEFCDETTVMVRGTKLILEPKKKAQSPLFGHFKAVKLSLELRAVQDFLQSPACKQNTRAELEQFLLMSLEYRTWQHQSRTQQQSQHYHSWQDFSDKLKQAQVKSIAVLQNLISQELAIRATLQQIKDFRAAPKPSQLEVKKQKKLAEQSINYDKLLLVLEQKLRDTQLNSRWATFKLQQLQQRLRFLRPKFVTAVECQLTDEITRYLGQCQRLCRSFEHYHHALLKARHDLLGLEARAIELNNQTANLARHLDDDLSRYFAREPNLNPDDGLLHHGLRALHGLELKPRARA